MSKPFSLCEPGSVFLELIFCARSIFSCKSSFFFAAACQSSKEILPSFNLNTCDVRSAGGTSIISINANNYFNQTVRISLSLSIAWRGKELKRISNEFILIVLLLPILIACLCFELKLQHKDYEWRFGLIPSQNDMPLTFALDSHRSFKCDTSEEQKPAQHRAPSFHIASWRSSSSVEMCFFFQLFSIKCKWEMIHKSKWTNYTASCLPCLRVYLFAIGFTAAFLAI